MSHRIPFFWAHNMDRNIKHLKILHQRELGHKLIFYMTTFLGKIQNNKH